MALTHSQRKKCAFCLALLLILAPFGTSTARGEDVVTTSDVVVTASGYEQDIREAPATISVITRQEMENKSVNSLADALRSVPGVAMIGGDTGTISIRGMQSDHVLILVDGKRQNTSSSTVKGGIDDGLTTNWMPPVSAIERIEVVRGPMSTLYGSDALGGVINIITRKYSEKWSGSFTTDATIREEPGGKQFGGDLYVSGPIIKDKLGIQVWGKAMTRDEADEIDGMPRHRKLDGTAKLWFTPIDGQEFMFSYVNARQIMNQTAGKNLAEGSANKYSFYDRQEYGFNYSGELPKGKLEVGTYLEEVQSFGSSTGTPFLTNWTVDAKYNVELGPVNLVVGGQHRYQKLNDPDGYYSTLTSPGQSTDGGKVETMEEALFLEAEWFVVDNFSLTGGVRYTYNQDFGGYWTPRGYAVWNFLPNWTIKGGVAMGYKSPTAAQLDPSFGLPQRNGSITRGNPDLKPELSTNYELGLYYHDDRLRANVTGFYTYYRNKIANTGSKGFRDADGNMVYDPANPGEYLSIYYNINGARLGGVEASISYDFTPSLTATANYTYTYSRIDNASDNPYNFKYESAEGARLVATPEHMANLTVDWKPLDNLSTFAKLAYRGKEEYMNWGQGGSLQHNSEDMVTIDFGLTYEIVDGLKVSGAVYNVTNAKRSNDDSYTYPEDGRRYWFQVAWEF